MRIGRYATPELARKARDDRRAARALERIADEEADRAAHILAESKRRALLADAAAHERELDVPQERDLD